MPVTYWKPAPALSGLVTGYHRYRVTLPDGATLSEAFFPSWATIRIARSGSRGWSLRLGPRTFDPVPHVAFCGPTSYAGYLQSAGGELVGIGILPLGWARLFGGDIARHANRIVPLDDLEPDVDDVVAMLEAAGDEPNRAFDAWLLRRLAVERPVHPKLADLAELLEDPAVTRIETIGERLALGPRALAALTRFNFGFTPKLLLRRRRFLHALSLVLRDPEAGTQGLHQAGYWDRSHFLRDSHLFLGCSIREFKKRRGPLGELAMKAREEVMGTPV